MRRFRCSVSDDDMEQDECCEIPLPTVMPSLSETLQKITVCVLGASQVGKSSIIRQFVDYKPISRLADTVLGHQSYHTTIVINSELYELNIIECPAFCHFVSPHRSSNNSNMNIHKADAHLLVYDVTNKDSLQYIYDLSHKLIAFEDRKSKLDYHHVQNSSSANKNTDVLSDDLISQYEENSLAPSASGSTTNQPSYNAAAASTMQQSPQSPSLSLTHVANVGNNYDKPKNPAPPIMCASNPSASTSSTLVSRQTPVVIVGNKFDMPENLHISNLERAAYFSQMPARCPYVESSAKCNWHIMEIFKELMKVINIQCEKENRQINTNGKDRMNQCAIL